MPGDAVAGLRARVGDLRQVASLRRITLEDGPEAGVRALAFSTGGGLDFWALADRSLDIGPLWYRGVSIAWIGPMGFRSPALHDAEGDGGTGFNRSFSGFLVTCGLDHVRQPRDGRPLHGRLPFTPARVLAAAEDWDRPEPVLACEGEVIQARYGAEALRLRRRIEAPVGGTALTIEDTVENLGAEPWPHALLYHVNLGYPAVDRGTCVGLGHDRVLGPLDPPEAEAPPARSLPAGDGPEAVCRVETPVAGGAFAMSLAFGTAGLPHLQLWRDLRPRAGVLSVEPCTSARGPDGRSVDSRLLHPGERCTYVLRISFEGALPALTD